MKKNMGKTDRTLRIIAGIIILAAGLYLKSWWGLIGLIPLGTALIGWCPLYVPFKISTGEKDGAQKTG
jgi:sulfite exporter TauE/SafE